MEHLDLNISACDLYKLQIWPVYFLNSDTMQLNKPPVGGSVAEAAEFCLFENLDLTGH